MALILWTFPFKLLLISIPWFNWGHYFGGPFIISLYVILHKEGRSLIFGPSWRFRISLFGKFRFGFTPFWIHFCTEVSLKILIGTFSQGCFQDLAGLTLVFPVKFPEKFSLNGSNLLEASSVKTHLLAHKHNLIWPNFRLKRPSFGKHFPGLKTHFGHSLFLGGSPSLLMSPYCHCPLCLARELLWKGPYFCPQRGSFIVVASSWLFKKVGPFGNVFSPFLLGRKVLPFQLFL